MRSWKGGRTSGPGFLEDHAFLAQGLLDLYEATFDVRWLAEAVSLSEEIEARFADPRGGWFATAADHEKLLAREKPAQDGAEPSGASVALLNALRLSAFTADDRWRAVAERALRWYAPVLEDRPLALAEMLLALDFHGDAVREIVLVWPRGEREPEPFLAALRATFLPSRALAGAEEGPALEALGRVARVARDKKAIGGKATAYVCERGACRLPAIDVEKLQAQIDPVRPYR